VRPGGLSRSVRAFLSPAEAPDQRLCADSGSGSSRSGPGSAAHVTVRYVSRDPLDGRPLIAVVQYKRSSFCNFGDCVEVGHLPDGSFAVRDTKDPQRRTELTFTRDEWDAFVKGVKNGEFDPAS